MPTPHLKEKLLTGVLVALTAGFLAYAIVGCVKPPPSQPCQLFVVQGADAATNPGK